MSSIIQQLASPQAWEEFLARRLSKGQLNWNEFEAFDKFVEREEYLPVVESIIEGGTFGLPTKRVLNKMGTGKKRVVYTFQPVEMTVLKVLSYLLYKYDSIFAPNCYAFRRGVRASDAVLKVYNAVHKQKMWCYKLDISNYYNSIPVEPLLAILREVLHDDTMLYSFFERLLSEGRAIYNDEIIREERGTMAGVPVASFLANVYLRDVDHYFHDKGIIYARYSDDIVIFAESREQLEEYRTTILTFIEERGLKVNPSKERIYQPDEAYEFLGFKCFGNQIDIADASIQKMKGKIRRRMHSLLRWRKRKGVSSERAMERLINHFNKKFFDNDEDRELSWSRWYFPVINCANGLQIIDRYLQPSVRALATGKHNKANYRITYSKLKELGYRSLVHEYYEMKGVSSS